MKESLDAPSDFRIRDYMLGEVLFKTLGINVYLLCRKGWNEINSVTDLQIELDLGADCIGNSNVRNFSEIYSRKNVLSDIKLVPHLVVKMSNLNNFSLNQYLYLKHKRLVQMKYPSIAHEVEMRLKVRVQQFRSSRRDKSHSFCLNRFGFIPNVEKSIEENMKLVLEQRTAACYFNECNNMAFHDLSRDKVATATHNLTSLLGLGAKLCPQTHQVSFKNSEALITRLRRDIRTRYFILNNSNIERDTLSSILHRKSDKWEPNKASWSIEGAMDRFELALKRDFGSLRHTKCMFPRCRHR